MTYKSHYVIQHTRFYQCGRKKQYVSIGEAETAVNQVWAKYRSKQEPYKCRFCGGWHLRTVKNEN